MVPSLSPMQADSSRLRVPNESVAAAALPHMRSLPAIPVLSVRYRPQRNGTRIGLALRILLLEVLLAKAVQTAVHMIKLLEWRGGLVIQMGTS